MNSQLDVLHIIHVQEDYIKRTHGDNAKHIKSIEWSTDGSGDLAVIVDSVLLLYQPFITGREDYEESHIKFDPNNIKSLDWSILQWRFCASLQHKDVISSFLYGSRSQLSALFPSEQQEDKQQLAILLASVDGIYFWSLTILDRDSMKCQLLWSIKMNSVRLLTLSEDKRHIATNGYYDRHIKVWYFSNMICLKDHGKVKKNIPMYDIYVPFSYLSHTRAVEDMEWMSIHTFYPCQSIISRSVTGQVTIWEEIENCNRFVMRASLKDNFASIRWLRSRENIASKEVKQVNGSKSDVELSKYDLIESGMRQLKKYHKIKEQSDWLVGVKFNGDMIIYKINGIGHRNSRLIITMWSNIKNSIQCSLHGDSDYIQDVCPIKARFVFKNDVNQPRGFNLVTITSHACLVTLWSLDASLVNRSLPVVLNRIQGHKNEIEGIYSHPMRGWIGCIDKEKTSVWKFPDTRFADRLFMMHQSCILPKGSSCAWDCYSPIIYIAIPERKALVAFLLEKIEHESDILSKYSRIKNPWSVAKEIGEIPIRDPENTIFTPLSSAFIVDEEDSISMAKDISYIAVSKNKGRVLELLVIKKKRKEDVTLQVKSIKPINLESGKAITCMCRVQSNEVRTHKEKFTGFSLITGHENGDITLWRLRKVENDNMLILENIIQFNAHQEPVSQIKCASPYRIASTSSGKEIRIWECESAFPYFHLEGQIPVYPDELHKKQTLIKPFEYNVASYRDHRKIVNEKESTSMSFEWMSTNMLNFSLIVNIAGKSRVWTLKSPNDLFISTPKWSLIHTTRMSGRCLTFTHQGQLVMIGDNLLKVYMQFSDDDTNEKVENAIKSLPFYHPKVIMEYIVGGRLDRIHILFKYLLVNLSNYSNKDKDNIFIPPPQFFPPPDLEVTDTEETVEAPDEKVQIEDLPEEEDMFVFRDPFSKPTPFESSGNRFGNDMNHWNNILSEDKESDDEKCNEISTETQEEEELPIFNNSIDWNFESLTSKEVKRLIKYLKRFSLYGLSGIDQIQLIALLETLTNLERTLTDLSAIRFILLIRFYYWNTRNLKGSNSETELSSLVWFWALHCSDQPRLIETCLPEYIEMNWNVIKSLGIPLWSNSVQKLRDICQDLAKREFKRTKNPVDCAIYYILLGRISALAALYNTTGNDQDKKVAEFLKNDFTDKRWITASKKNAFVLMSKQQYTLSIAFFLLGGHIQDAVEVCLKKLNDPMLAVFICRISSIETGDKTLYFNVLQTLLDKAGQDGDVTLISIIKWMKQDYTGSILALSPSSDSVSSITRNPYNTVEYKSSIRHFIRFSKKLPHYKQLLKKGEIHDLGWMQLSGKILYNMLYSGLNRVVIQDIYDEQKSYEENSCEALISITKKSVIQFLCKDIEHAMTYNKEFHLEDYNEILDILVRKFKVDMNDVINSVDHFCDSKFYIKQRYLIVKSRDMKAASQLLIKNAQKITSAASGIIDMDINEALIVKVQKIAQELWECLEIHCSDSNTNLSSKATCGIKASIRLGMFITAWMYHDFDRILKILNGLYPFKSDACLTLHQVEENSDDNYIEKLLMLLVLYKFAAQTENGLSKSFVSPSALNIVKLVNRWVQSVEKSMDQIPEEVLFKYFIPDTTQWTINIKAMERNDWGIKRIDSECLRSIWTLIAADFSTMQYLSNFLREYTQKEAKHAAKLAKSKNLKFHEKHVLIKDRDVIRSFCMNSIQPQQIAVALNHGITEISLDTKQTISSEKISYDKMEATLWLEAHPNLPYYLSANASGSVNLWQFNMNQPLAHYKGGSRHKCNRVRFNWNGSRFGAVDSEGILEIWRFDSDEDSTAPYFAKQCHKKSANDLVFVNSGSVLAVCGESAESKNVSLWDTLLPPNRSNVHNFICQKNGATTLAYYPKNQILLCGGHRGLLSILDVRQRKVMKQMDAHLKCIKALHIDETRNVLVTGSSDGSAKIWDLDTFMEISSFRDDHIKGGTFGRSGVSQAMVFDKTYLSSGLDGRFILREML